MADHDWAPASESASATGAPNRFAGLPNLDLERLKCARVIIVGAGNIGSHLASFIARAGIGQIGIVDRDRVSAENCTNQDFLHIDVGHAKSDVLAERLRREFPHVEINSFAADLEDVPLGHFQVDVLLGCLDSRRARQTLVSEIGGPLGITVVDGGVGEGLRGRVQVFVPSETSACLECTWGKEDYRMLAAEYPCSPGGAFEAPPTLSPAFMGATVASFMAAECVQLLAGELPTQSRELAFDLCHRRFLESRLRRAPSCRFDHERVEERIYLTSNFASATVADLLAGIERRFAGKPVSLECPRRLLGSRFLACADLLPRPTEVLSGIGFDAADAIRIRSDGRSVLLFLQESKTQVPEHQQGRGGDVHGAD